MAILKKNMELLAPAGSIESFFAAFENGADAVFCGLTSFSARARAKNFAPEELDQLAGYAHSRGKKIYVALNTLIKDAELPHLADLLAEIERVAVDGLIIQDFGLYSLARNCFPEIPLHASTQMGIHNLAGVRMLEKMGFSRAVLARELSLEEIGFIGRQSSLELEHFVHGALCYSVSGHCLFSSYLDGRSGNRGRCSQPCRRRYHNRQESGFYFSTSDFSAIEMIPELVKAGVMSLKIEGRMKNAEYVAAVVSAYRTVLDAPSGNEKAAVREAKQKLENAMGRKSSPGFLPGLRATDIVLPKQKGGIGRILGKVERIQGGSVSFTTRDTLHVGDRIRIQPGNDRAGQGFTIRKMYLGKHMAKRAAQGRVVSLPLPFKGKMVITAGDLIFKLGSGKTFTMSEEACRRRLAAAPLHKDKVEMAVQCGDRELIVCASASGVEITKKYPVDMIAATHSPLSEETLLKVFSHTGVPTLMLEGFSSADLPPVVIKPSSLKTIRRDFYASFLKVLEKQQQADRKARQQKVQGVLSHWDRDGQKTSEERLYIVTDQKNDLMGVSDHSDVHFVFSLTAPLLEMAEGYENWGTAEKKRVSWDLPSVVFDQDWPNLQGLVDAAMQSGFSHFRLNNPAHLQLFRPGVNVHLTAGPWLYTLNSQAISGMQDLGISDCCLSIEDDRENIGKLQEKNGNERLVLTIFSPVELFSSRVPVPAQRKKVTLENDRGELLSLEDNRGLTITSAQRPFSLMGRIRQLRKMGCRSFGIDLRGVGFLTGEGQEIRQAFYEDRMLPGTTLFNFERGLA
jgi:U32 family peptidase